ncbi:nitronate monooxygenase [Brevundimonas sp. EYE_349]|uniref:NAD(P)H-dependent flavin oxidoreductase n=1 Tax=Brevundimonas sp. EYE_349 TaxID=2853455 RepID=UPI002004DE2B|nr:nitronate monooxygenase [Brevundimonas sp. EYE_349]MCK6103447.1 nitronate monooxygenase [Brevundimonas sp. EYE_349]
MSLIDRLGLSVPVIQAPMAGVSTPRMAAAVSNAGALGSISVGATDAVGAGQMIADTRALTDRPFNVNLFVHAAPRRDPVNEAAWLQALAPQFAAFGAAPPAGLGVIYRSFADDDAMLARLLADPPAAVSFHFGLPDTTRIRALKAVGCLLLATATTLDEALTCKAAGVDALVAQGWEAGGHRGMFDPDAEDSRLGAMALTRLLVARAGPVITAGGIMDGQGVRAAPNLGAVAVQMGTAFVACPESAADAGYRAALAGDAALHTVMTRAISGRPARCLANRFTAWDATTAAVPPDYPVAYDAGKALNAAAKSAGEFGFGAQWAGQGAALARTLPAADLIAALVAEMDV